MKKKLFFIAGVAIIALAAVNVNIGFNNNSNINLSLTNILALAMGEDYYCFRVYLKDKGDTLYSVDQPEAFLSKTAIELTRLIKHWARHLSNILQKYFIRIFLQLPDILIGFITFFSMNSYYLHEDIIHFYSKIIALVMIDKDIIDKKQKIGMVVLPYLSFVISFDLVLFVSVSAEPSL